MPQSLSPPQAQAQHLTDELRAPARVEPIDLTNATSVLAETSSALALTLREGDLDAAERLFGFIIDQSPDRRAAVTGVLAGMLLGNGGCALMTPAECSSATTHEFLRRLRRPVSAIGGQGVLLHCPDDGLMAVMLELAALLLDEAHVPVHIRRGVDIAATGRTATGAPISAVAIGAPDHAEAAQAEPVIRQLRRAGIGVVLVADPDIVAPEVARIVGASCAAWQPGEIADVVLRLRGPLTRGEAEVLRLAADGYTNVRIAHELDVSLSAIKARLEASYAKLNASDRTHAVAIALRQHWIQ